MITWESGDERTVQLRQKVKLNLHEEVIRRRGGSYVSYTLSVSCVALTPRLKNQLVPWASLRCSVAIRRCIL